MSQPFDPFRSPSADSQLLPWSPYLRLAHDFRDTPVNWHHNKACLGDHALHYFFDGEGEYRIDGHDYPIKPKTVFLRRPGENSEFRTQGTPHMLNLHFDLIEIAESHCAYPCPDSDYGLKARLPADLPCCQQLNNYSMYEQTFFALLETAGRQGAAAHLHRKSLMLEILSLLYANFIAAQSANTLNHHQQAVEKALKYINSHPEKHPTLDELATVAGISRALFCRVFRENVGATPQKYLNQHRIELATAELLYSETPIKEIALRCGFADVHHFTRIFKLLTGQTPAAFRTRHNLDE